MQYTNQVDKGTQDKASCRKNAKNIVGSSELATCIRRATHGCVHASGKGVQEYPEKRRKVEK